jgi:hypothetical protein
MPQKIPPLRAARYRLWRWGEALWFALTHPAQMRRAARIERELVKERHARR